MITLCIALLLLLVGWIFVKLIMCVVKKALRARKSMDPTLQRWLISVLGATLKIFLVIVFIDALGIETLSIAGMIAAIGVAIGTALSGVVQNFAAGVIIVGFATLVTAEHRAQSTANINNNVVTSHDEQAEADQGGGVDQGERRGRDGGGDQRVHDQHRDV